MVALEAARVTNVCPQNFGQLSHCARRALRRMRQRSTLVIAFGDRRNCFRCNYIMQTSIVRKLVLCEAPAVSLLDHLPGDQSAIGKQTLADIQARMVKPMQAAFRKGDEEAGVRVFIGYVMRDPQAWNNMSKAAHEEILKNVREWDVMMTTGELFPNLDAKAVRNIHAPVVLLSGVKSYPFLGLIDEELARLLPDNRRIILSGATHRMWFEQPDECRRDVLHFLREKSELAATRQSQNSASHAAMEDNRPTAAKVACMMVPRR